MTKRSGEGVVIFVSYNGLLEPILASQGIPYLDGLARKGYRFILLTYEKKDDLDKVGRSGIETIRKDLETRGIEWIHLRYHKRPKVISTLFDIAAGSCCLVWLALSRGARLVHVRGATPGAMAMPLFVFGPAKVLFDMRGRLAEEMAAGNLWKTDSVPFRLIKTAEKFLLKHSDAVTVLTRRHFEYNQGLDYFRGRDIPKEVIPCCVDMRSFTYAPAGKEQVKKELGLDGKFVLMYQGKLATFYRVDEMLDFYRRMLTSRPDAVFVVLTPDDPRPLAEKAALRGIGQEKVKIFMNVPFAIIPRYLQMADAGIFFINAHEKLGSSPIKLGEFLSCGVPVIINPGVGDSDSMVIEGKAGVVVGAYGEREYDEAIAQLSSLLGEGEELRKRCRETARKYLSLEDGISQYDAIYKALIPKS